MWKQNCWFGTMSETRKIWRKNSKHAFFVVSDNFSRSSVMVWLLQATKAPCGRPLPRRVRRRMERNRQKVMDWDKGSLTKQQTKGTVTTMIKIRRKHNTNHTTEPLSRTAAACSQAASEFLPPSSLLNRNPAWRHMVWNTLLCMARLGQPAWLRPLLDCSET